MYQKLEEERPLALELDPRAELLRRGELWLVDGAHWEDDLVGDNATTQKVIREEERRRLEKYEKMWEEEVWEVYRREREEGVALTHYVLCLEELQRTGPWGQLVARTKSKFFKKIREEEELKEKRAPYLLLEEGKREEEERSVREKYFELESDPHSFTWLYVGMMRRSRLSVYRDALSMTRSGACEDYVAYRKTKALRRITLEEEAKRGRREEVWEREEDRKELTQVCPHPFVCDEYLWKSEPKCQRCGRLHWEVDLEMAWEDMFMTHQRDTEEMRREVNITFLRSLPSRRLLMEMDTEERIEKSESGKKKATALKKKETHPSSEKEDRKELTRVRREAKKEAARPAKELERERKKEETKKRREATLLAKKEARAEVARKKKEATALKEKETNPSSEKEMKDKEVARVRREARKKTARPAKELERERKKEETKKRREATLLAKKEARAEVAMKKKEASALRKKERERVSEERGSERGSESGGGSRNASEGRGK